MLKLIVPVLLVVLIAACVSQTPDNAQQNQTSVTPPAGWQELPPQPPATGLKEFSVIIGHTFYSPSTFTVNKGDTVRFLANAAKGTGTESGLNHNHGMTIDAYGVNQAVAVEDVNNPVVIEFVADRAGEFTIYCKTCLDGPFGTNHPAIQAKLIVNG